MGITVTAFIGTLLRGVIKKNFLAIISLLAFISMGIGLWQSLAQRGIVGLADVCQGPDFTKSQEAANADGTELLNNLKANKVEYVDCAEPENFFLYNLTGITLANSNVILMLLIGLFSFYKLFFKPRRKYRRYNNKYNNRNNNNNNNNRRYRGSGYRRSNNRNRRPYNGDRSYNNRNDSDNS